MYSNAAPNAASNNAAELSADLPVEIRPCDHLVQIFASDEALVDALDRFVTDGIERSESVVLITTPGHLGAINQRLRDRGVDLDRLRAHQMYIALDAAETLQKFQVRDWPDEALFLHFVHRIIARAGGRQIRVFGEMATLLWAQGNTAAMLRLEQLWHKVCEKGQLTLFCAYPRSGFNQGSESSIRDIHNAHSRVLG